MERSNGLYSSSDEYFAAADTDRIAGLLDEKVHDWIMYTQSSTTYMRMRESWKMYYGLSPDGFNASSRIRETGPQGEYSLIYCNHYRNLLQHLLVLTTSQRPALDCRAANTDADTIKQCELGNALLDWYMKAKRFERYMRNSVEYGLFLSEGFMSMDWDPTKGNIYAVNPQTGQPVYEGDIVLENYTPLDVVRDPWRNNSKLPWCIVIRWKNKFDIAAKYPDMADQIIGIKPDLLWQLRNDFFNRTIIPQTDLIPEMTFYHEKSECLPQGRMVKFLSKDVMLLDTPMPYSRIPVFRTAPSDQADTPFGYTPGFDLMGPQIAINLLDSIILTNQKTHGLGVVVAPEGNNIQYTQLAEGLAMLTVNEKNGTLRPVNFTNTPPEIFKFREQLKEDQQDLSAVNSVVRGNPSSSITSGSFAALIASQAIEFNAGLEMSYTQLQEDVGGMIIEMLQKFATTQRVAKIVGKNNQYMVQSFCGADLKDIQTVTVDVANPVSKTTAGKMQMADDLIKMGEVKNSEQYLTVMETGKLEPLVQNQQTSLNNIRMENEALMDGQSPSVMITDDHHQHILEHMSILDDPTKRGNPKYVGPVTEHCMAHIQLWKSTDPGFLQALGRVPLILQNMQGMGLPTPQAPQAPQAPQGPQMPPQGGQPMGPAGGSMQKLMNAQPGPGPKDLPRGPNMPVNPQTGQRVPAPMGPAGAQLPNGASGQ